MKRRGRRDLRRRFSVSEKSQGDASRDAEDDDQQRRKAETLDKHEAGCGD
jgi:hypothetical protein